MRKLLSVACVLALLILPSCTPNQGGDEVAGQPAPTVPTPPLHVEITGRGQLPPFYTLRWVTPNGVTVDHFNVFRSSAAIDTTNSAAAFVGSATENSLVVSISPDTGVQFFRVSLVDTDGNESPLSIQYALDTARRVIYRADAIIDDTFELFTIPLTGGTPIRISGVVPPGRTVRQYAWSPDGQRIAFVADLDYPGRPELYVTSPDGTVGPVKMSGATVTWADVTAFAWSPDGEQLAFISDRLTDDVFNLYSVRLINRTPLLLSQFLPRRTDYDGVLAFAWSADSTRIAYTADSYTDNLFELFVVNPNLPNPNRVSGALAPLQNVFSGVLDFAWAPDGSQIAYTANSTFDGTRELFSTSSIGGAVQNLSGPSIAQGKVRQIAWSPDSTTVAFTADKDIKDAIALYTVPGDASASPLIVSGILLPDSRVDEFAWTRQGLSLAFRGDVEVLGLKGLYTVDPTGTNRVLVSGPLVQDGFVRGDWAWSNDSNQLAFRGSLGVALNDQLFTTQIDNINPINQVPQLMSDRAIRRFYWTTDGTQIVFTGDLENPGQSALYLAPTDPSAGIVTRIAGFLPPFGNVTNAATSPLSSEDIPAAVFAQPQLGTLAEKVLAELHNLQ